jgi:starch synthase (maltosyl-transferring)
VAALADVFHAWAARGVRAFRVDNPHTKSLAFWEWCLADVRARWPDSIFLSEAFTRPLLLERLAKVGYSQSYTYFTWRTTAASCAPTARSCLERVEFLRPTSGPTRPTSCPSTCRSGGRPPSPSASSSRPPWPPATASTARRSSSCDARAHPGKEEYLDSEKFELKRWNLRRRTACAT